MVLTLCLVSAIFVFSTAAITQEPTDGMERLSRAQQQFAFQMYSAINSNASSTAMNILMSPSSIASVLSMLYLGSAGETSAQLRKVLAYEELTFVEAHRSYRKLVAALASTATNFANGRGVRFDAANQIFVQEGVNISLMYQGALRELYDAELQSVDFTDGSSSNLAQDLINAWVRIHTRGKITTMIDRAPDPSTKVLLANALYFNGSWLHEFDPKRTFPNGRFHLEGSDEMITIPMMSARVKVPYGRSTTHACTVLELPYEGNRLGMMLILPDGSLSDFEGRLRSKGPTASVIFRDLVAALKEELVNVRLPRFRLESHIQLREPLQSLGLEDVFVEGLSDLSGITNGMGDIYVADIVHKAIIEVTEVGSEVAAATSVDVERSGTVGETYFEANRPFIFIILDHRTRVILFFGRIVNPVQI